jgi:hypothetical protein
MTQADASREKSPASSARQTWSSRSGPWTDLGLTVPIFLGYHLAVVFLPYRNAADFVTRELTRLAHDDLLSYSALTLGIGAAFVGTLILLGRGKVMRWDRFLWIALEGVAYAVAMRLIAGYVVGRLALAGGLGDRMTGLVLSLGAGFYEEVAFRVVLFGLGVRLLDLLLFKEPDRKKQFALRLFWAVAAAAAFSGWHHVGALGDPFELKVFVFRWICGLVFTLIYAVRGFAPAVWTHTLYDIWVLVL